MDEYKALLLVARNKRRDLTERRNELVKQVEEIDRQLLGLNQAVEGYEFILKEPSTGTPGIFLDPETVGLTEAIRKIFSTRLGHLFPTDIRDRLAQAGYEKTSSKALLIHVHNVLERLCKSGEIESTEVDGRSAYQKKYSTIPPLPFLKYLEDKK